MNKIATRIVGLLGLATSSVTVLVLAIPVARAQDHTLLFTKPTARAGEQKVTVAAAGPTSIVPPTAINRPRPAPTLTPEQMRTFSDLVGEPEQAVQERILTNPGLVPLAIAATHAREEREKSGKELTISGFAILGIGAIVGLLIAAEADLGHDLTWNCDRTCEQHYQDGRNTGIAVGLVSAAAGLAFAIPGIFKLSRRSDAEVKAARHYLRTEIGRPPLVPQSSSFHMPAVRSGTAFNFPLLSFVF